MLSENDIKEPPENFKGEVNLEKFWEALSKEIICQGLVESTYSYILIQCLLHYIVNY